MNKRERYRHFRAQGVSVENAKILALAPTFKALTQGEWNAVPDENGYVYAPGKGDITCRDCGGPRGPVCANCRIAQRTREAEEVRAKLQVLEAVRELKEMKAEMDSEP